MTLRTVRRKDPATTPHRVAAGAEPSSGTASIAKALAILDVVAERGATTARELADTLGYPLPTVYRVAKAFVDAGYLVHLRASRSYALGYKVHQLGVSLHRQIGVSSAVKAQITVLHEHAEAAGYFAVYRGADVVVVHVADCRRHPRLRPIRFGFHEGAHATAFGKIMLNGMNDDERDRYFRTHPLTPLTPFTITDRAALDRHLEFIALDGIAWEREEFLEGTTCAAIGVRDAAGLTVGSVAISAPTETIAGRERIVERALREASGEVSRYFRAGGIHRHD